MNPNHKTMLRKFAQWKQLTRAEPVRQWQPKTHSNLHTNPLILSSKSPFSSNWSKKSSSLHNYYIRKRRKWPIQPYKLQYPQLFAYQLAIQSFKTSIRKSREHPLTALISSFQSYEINPTPKAYIFLFKALLQNPNSIHQIPQILDHIEKVENFETPECLFIELIKFYGNYSMFDEAVEIFFRIPMFRCEPSVESLNALLLVLCKNEIGLQIIPSVLIKTQEMNIRIEESSFVILIRALCKIGKVADAFQLLCCLVEDGFVPDQKIMSLILETKCKQKNAGQVVGFLWDLKMFGFEPRNHDMCNVIRYLVRNGKGMEALKVLRQMKVDRITPDITCYNLVLDGLFLEGDFARADKLFDELLVLGLVPDVCTYNVYIWGLCMQNKVEEGIKIFSSMEDLGCSPNLHTFLSILCALCETGEPNRVQEMLCKMRQRSIRLNSEAYEIMIDRLITYGDTDGAYGFLKEMLHDKFVPRPMLLDEIIFTLCNRSLYTRAVELLEEVVENKLVIGIRAWEVLVQGSVLKINLESLVNLAKDEG